MISVLYTDLQCISFPQWKSDKYSALVLLLVKKIEIEIEKVYQQKF